MADLIGYSRVSTVDQDPALQLDALKAYGVERLYVDQASGATTARPELAAALKFLRRGDVLVVWRLDRLGRSTADLLALVAELERAGVELRSLTEGIDTRSPGGRLVFTIFAALAEFEREIIRERTRAGLAAARARGRRGGRPAKMTPERARAALTMQRQGHSQGEIARVFNVSQTAVSRALVRARAALDQSPGPPATGQ